MRQDSFMRYGCLQSDDRVLITPVLELNTAHHYLGWRTIRWISGWPGSGRRRSDVGSVWLLTGVLPGGDSNQAEGYRKWQLDLNSVTSTSVVVSGNCRSPQPEYYRLFELTALSFIVCASRWSQTRNSSLQINAASCWNSESGSLP